MRCIACDRALSDLESTRKSKTIGEYLDLCNTCFSTVSDDFIDNEEQLEQHELEENLEYDSDGEIHCCINYEEDELG